MRLVNESGLWTTRVDPAPIPAVAVLEVSGAVLSWPVDDPAWPPVVSFTDADRADWMWRVFGETGHVAVVEALRDADPVEVIELPSVAVLPGSTDCLRRLALGHWLRRWWPASARGGISALDQAVLDAEVAVLTAAAQDYFTDDTLDADVSGLLARHGGALLSHRDARVGALAARCQDLADELGLEWDTRDVGTARREDYALAAGGGDDTGPADTVADGQVTIPWSAVPAGIFDAAEDNLGWAVFCAGSIVSVRVRAALCGPDSAVGLPVSLHCGTFQATGVLDAEGRGIFPVFDVGGQPADEAKAWDTDWSATRVSVGADRADESRELRDRMRAFARTRLGSPADDAFLAEVLAAESDY